MEYDPTLVFTQYGYCQLQTEFKSKFKGKKKNFQTFKTIHLMQIVSLKRHRVPSNFQIRGEQNQ